MNLRILCAFTTLWTVVALTAPAFAADDRTVGKMPVSAPADPDKPKQKYTANDDRMAGPRTVKKTAEDPEEKKETPAKPAKKTNDTEKSAAKKKSEPDESESDDKVLNEKQDQEESEKDYAVSEKPAKSRASVPAVLKVNYTNLESLGTLYSTDDGSLGIDLWDGSSRKDILDLLSRLPATGHYGALNTLVQRTLLTSTDARFMSDRGNIAPGEDFQTRRIEKLLDMGAYESAARLYLTDYAVPYHERLARAGVQALFLSSQPTIACLETKTVMVRFQNEPFWKKASVVCDYLLGKLGGGLPKDFLKRDDVKEIMAESRVTADVFNKPGFRITPKAPDAFKNYTPLEMALLLNDKRISLSKVDFGNIRAMPSHALGIIMMVDEASGPLKLRLRGEAVRRGLIAVNDLAAYYESVDMPLGGVKNAKGWVRIPALYQAAKASKAPPERQNLARQALALAPDFGELALLPFGPWLAGIKADSLTPGEIRLIARITLQSGLNPHKSIIKSIFEQSREAPPSREISALALSAMLSSDFSTEESKKSEKTPDVAQLSKNMPETLKILISSIYEKLDNEEKLHNIAGIDVYENKDSLTSSVDYVMPSGSLMENLSTALSERRLGEVILLSSIAMSETPPDKVSPEVFGNIVDGLMTVGLTSEARELTSQVILGLSLQKEN